MNARRPARWAGAFFVCAALFFSLAFFRPGDRSTGLPADALYLTKDIQDVEPGQRTLGTNPLGAESDTFDISDPAEWRKVILVVTKLDGTRLDAELLRPLDWIEQLGAAPGATIEIDLSELGVRGEARVLAIEPSPPIQPGPGNLVTGRFRHQATDGVINVYIAGEPGPIGCTSNHPFWSEDRQSFIPAGQLNPGEHVRTRRHGVVPISHITPRPGAVPVYNLEIQGQHVYEVGQSGLLVHNMCLLRPYSEGGGHHIFAKKAFEDVPGYDLNAALAIPNAELRRLGLDHIRGDSITKKQRQLFSELAESGRPNTLEEHTRIAREALVAGGLSKAEARKVVDKALRQLKSWGIKAPSNIPWH